MHKLACNKFETKAAFILFHFEASTESSSATDTISSGGQHIINISDELQDELCQLWDMSSDSDVAKLLQEYKAVDILTEVISKSDAPRATVSLADVMSRTVNILSPLISYRNKEQDQTLLGRFTTCES